MDAERSEVRRAPLALVGPVRHVDRLVPAVPASAGGNWLEFREDPRAGAARSGSADRDPTLGTWAVMYVGQHVVAATGIYATDPRHRHLENEGPFYAWLVP